jgi:hypothetical protein
MAVTDEKCELIEASPHESLLRSYQMPIPSESSLKMIKACLDPETSKTLSLPLAALVIGALSEVETTIQLANQVYDRYFTNQTA